MYNQTHANQIFRFNLGTAKVSLAIFKHAFFH